MKRVLATAEATVRSWLHTVHLDGSRFQTMDDAALVGSDVANMLFKGTLNAIVTSNIPAT